MLTCPSCGHENADGARFCSQCATPLTQGVTREERKVITCLFCDLVGFTARAEAMDPEDVRRLLQPYHASVRSELERFGGTVEKFIGDAVMAVFGAPVAHEDDPERAVRAALAIRDLLVEQGELEIRIGITTGEALVALGARPDAGEGMASGDVVNTAARLQTAAPTNGILVDETTFRATERTLEFGDPHAIEAKGKAEPVVVREALAARARVSVERVGGAALVGRDQELTLLREILARAVREREAQLVTLVGVPGIGKSRLVYELFQTIAEGSFGLVFWRHGRSLPYGDGVTFWALGEMVKAQAGILESDSSEQTGAKLREAVDRFVPDPSDAAWVERRLRPLAGLEADELSGDRRGESFAAWRRFLEAIADERPLVLVFEDLHWADDVLLDFVDYLADWASGAPLLVLATARPELLTRRPDWGGGRVNSATIQLSPLSDAETATLVHELLGRSAIEAGLQARLLEHAGGNPLYAEEFTRMLLERPTEAVVPENVQGMIAARLDTLPTEEKALLRDAAVLGRTFWLGALGRERWALEERLHSLARKGFVTRNRRSTVAGEDEYTFRHALVRDVAYEQITRAERAARHKGAAEWIESLGRPEDHAETVAHHYTAALEAARASGQDVEQLAERGRLALREAGDRAFSLNAFPTAARYYELAVQLWPTDDPALSELLLQLARARHISEDERGDQALEEAREALLASGRRDLAAEADALLAEAAWYRQDRERCDRHLARAAALVEVLPDSSSKALVLSQVSRYRMLADEYEDAIRIGEEALAMAERLGLDELRAHALDNIGTCRASLGDERGLAQLEQAAEIALAVRSPEATRALNNLSSAQAQLGDFRRRGELLVEAIRTAEELGALALARFERAALVANLIWTGAWDEALRLADEWQAEAGAEASSGELMILRNRALVRLARDDVDGALDDLDRALAGSRQMAEPQSLMPALGIAAHVHVELEREDDARAAASEFMEAARPKTTRAADWRMLEFAFVATRLGHADELRRLIEQLPATRMNAADLALVSDETGRAAELLDEGGISFFAAHARLLHGQQLAADGQHRKAADQLEQALAFYRSVRATRYIGQAEELLGDASEVSA
jgi:class 3 adenylate cyclase/tetratricopeptide (TPR) repeat protein